MAAGFVGFGMALLYPNLSAAVADISPPTWRGSAIGICRIWRDLDYPICALGLGLVARLVGGLDAAFLFVAVSMMLSGALLLRWGEETHPRLNPASDEPTTRGCSRSLASTTPYGDDPLYNVSACAGACAGGAARR